MFVLLLDVGPAVSSIHPAPPPREREREREPWRAAGSRRELARLGWPMVGGGPVFVVRRVLTEICMVMMIEEKKKGACAERERESRRNVAGNAILKHITQRTNHS